MRLLVYSHDAYGLGNIRRMLAICEHLLNEIPELSILLLSGSPMLQGFRMPKGLDYIKLPCLNRGETGEVAVRYLGMGIDETVKLRSELILSAAINFQPDLFLVDKKPYGLKNELTDTINYLQTKQPESRIVLLLRDILDSPEKTIAEWQKNGYYEALEKFYHQILVVGTPEVFDTVKEYKFPPALAEKVRYCGYMRRQPGLKSTNLIKKELQVLPEERLILVTPGGGEDGYELVDAYLSALALMPAQHQIKSLIICGPEMPAQQKQLVFEAAGNNSQVIIGEFTDDLMSYMQAADLVVSMAGYNTVCEILSAEKPAVILPRCKPSQEQLIRAECMAKLGLFQTIHPEDINHENLRDELLSQLKPQENRCFDIDMNGLPRVKDYICMLFTQTSCKRQLSKFYQKAYSVPSLVISYC
ncbi:MAG: glycosyltransferase family protein [Cyanomargarita calcarea GSE-NOS-MK-12-04C]|uniref:Glycosyltransferase family protein n=1 Tax=Cyanomargarita calcarea GSE-NOS-MK-12-04C TaxID=2839659 RepID=A0A951QJB8_9CYAN|nr:glycosyltransferase family protein [Cyanomargarita calcarea GSE-NOS-MK-12-04C]